MADRTAEIKFTFEGAAGQAMGKVGSAGDSPLAGIEKSTKGLFDKLKDFPKEIHNFSKTFLGIQLSLSAILRQSQIVTGFLGSLFQILGALLDAFLVAFAPTAFRAITDLAKLIPAFREYGERIVERVGGVGEILRIAWGAIEPAVRGIWNFLSAAWDIWNSLPDFFKQGLVALFAINQVLNLFVGTFFTKMLSVLVQAGITVAAKTKFMERGSAAVGLAGGLGLGALGLAGGIVLPAIVAAVFGIVASRSGGGGSGRDVTGQLGKDYLPPTSSQIGSAANEYFTQWTQPFTDNVIPVFNDTARIVGNANDGMGGLSDSAKGAANNIAGMAQDIIDIAEAHRRAMEKFWSEKNRSNGLNEGIEPGTGNRAQTNYETELQKAIRDDNREIREIEKQVLATLREQARLQREAIAQRNQQGRAGNIGFRISDEEEYY